MGSGPGKVEENFIIQRVGNQYQVQSTRWNQHLIRLMPGKYTISERSLKALEKAAAKSLNDPSKYLSLVQSLEHMLEHHPEDASLKDTLDKISRLDPLQVSKRRLDVSETEKIKTLDPKKGDSPRMCAIALSVISRAMAGLPEKPDSPLYGHPELLAQCFQEYLSSTKEITQRQLEQIIEAMIKNSNEGWDAMRMALGVLTRKDADSGLKKKVQAASETVVSRMFRQHAKTLQKQNGTDIGESLRQMYRLHELVGGAKLSPELLKNIGPSVKKFVDLFFRGYQFPVTLTLPSSRLLQSDKTPVEEEEVATWAMSCPSVALRHTYDRILSIQLGEQPVRKPEGLELSAAASLTQAYTYNQALVGYLGSKGVKEPQRVANELMLRSSGDVTLSNFLYSLPDMINSIQATEVGLREIDPVVSFKQPPIRFSVEGGMCTVYRSFPVAYISMDERTPRRLVWVESRVEFDPNAIGGRWTEYVTTKPYGEALADEVRRRVKEGATEDVARQEVYKELHQRIFEAFEEEGRRITEGTRTRMPLERETTQKRLQAEFSTLVAEMDEALKRPPQ